MEWLTSAEGLNARQELEASVREQHPHLRDEEVDLIVDGRLLRMVRERAAEQAPASGQQGGTGEGGAVHEAPTAVGIGGGAVAPTIDVGLIGTSYGQFKFGVEHISVTPLLEGRHDLTAWVSAIRPQLQCADLWQFCNGTAPSPAPNNPLQRREYAKGQMLAFMVLNRCVSPPIRMSIAGFSQQEKAGQMAWAYILSTYQARDALHASLLHTQLAQLRKGDDETAESYCNRARTIQAELLTIGQEVHLATFAAHVLKGLPPEYKFLRRKLDISSPDMTVERVCSEVLMEEQTLSIEHSYKQITSDASAFLGAVNTVVATTGVNNGKEGKGGKEQTDKKKDGKREKKRGPFRGRCYNCNEEGHMAAKCPNKKKDATPAAAANVAEGDGKGVALTVACSAAKLLADDKDLWFLDSGCSQHMTGCKEWFTVIRDPSATKSVKGFDGSMQEVAGVGEVLLEGTNGLRVTLHDVLFVPGMKANLVSPGQLLDKGAKLQTEEGVTRIIASGGQVAATARYRHRLHCLDLKPGPARNGATAAAACKGTAAAAACTDMAGGAASNGIGAAVACNGTAAATASNGTTKEIADNLPPPRTVIVVPVPSVQGGEQPLDRSVGPLGSKAPTAPPPFGPPSVADSAPVGPEDGPLEDGGDTTDLEEEGEVAVDEQPPVALEHEPSLTAPPIQPIPQPPRRSGRSKKGVPPVRFQPSALTAHDADEEENPYDMAYLAEDDCDTDSDDEVEYPDEDEEEEGAWGGVILDLAAASTEPEGKECHLNPS
ncbi:unnamed protein product [Closterium sp. NIES-65]|nr:unnamed protein product [Closterium sp. NIES-65]